MHHFAGIFSSGEDVTFPDPGSVSAMVRVKVDNSVVKNYESCS